VARVNKPKHTYTSFSLIFILNGLVHPSIWTKPFFIFREISKYEQTGQCRL
jgi:hypothetical protein